MTSDLLVKEVQLLSKPFQLELAQQVLTELYAPNQPPTVQIVDNPSDLQKIKGEPASADLHEKLYPLWNEENYAELFTFETAKPGYYFDIIKQVVISEDLYLNGYHLPVNRFLHSTQPFLARIARCLGFALVYEDLVVACQYPQIDFLDSGLNLQFKTENLIIPYTMFPKLGRRKR